MKDKVLIIGVGNIFRNDDGAGIFAVNKLKEKNLPHTKVIEQSGEGVALMNSWENFETVIIIDAVSSGAKPGKIHYLNAKEQIIPKKFFNYSTHAFSVAESIELARVLDKLPSKLLIYGIEGKDFSGGQILSPKVEASVFKVIDKITDYILKGEKDA